jgi:hypothetical protein
MSVFDGTGQTQSQFQKSLNKVFIFYGGGFAAFVIVLAALEQMGLPREFIGYAFLAATGAPVALTLPRFNVTFYKTPPLSEAGSALSLEGAISLSVFVIAIAIGIGAALVVYMLRQRRLALAKIFPEASEEASQIEKLQMSPKATRAGGRARPEVQLTPNASPMPSPPPSARAASYMDTAGVSGAEHQAEHEG